MIDYALGMMSGILLLGFLMLYKPRVERRFNQVASKLKPKGSIIEPEDNQVAAWVDDLTQDEVS